MTWFCISKAEVSRQHARLNLMTCAQRRLVFMGMVVGFCFLFLFLGLCFVILQGAAPHMR